MKITNLLSFIILIAFLCFPVLVHAQLDDPGGDPSASVPVDGGLSLLLAAGVGYTVKKIHDKRKKSTTENTDVTEK